MKNTYKNCRIDRIGETNLNNFGNKMTIIQYSNNANIVVRFENGYTTQCSYQYFKTGDVKSLYDKSVYKVGYLGEGKYAASFNRKCTLYYMLWTGMLGRCYNLKYTEQYLTYKGCTVCEEWLCYQNFATWVEKNFYQLLNEEINLDKDILIKGNKIYSPETCIFVPERINLLFTKCNKSRGEFPIGISRYNQKFQAHCSDGIKNIGLGTFITLEEAFNVYKQAKENLIKQVADEYRDKIPKKLYDALYRYEVEITD
jgi:hypothetical protein